MRVSALIARAGLAPLNKTAIGYKDWVCAVTDLGSGPVAIWSLVRLDKDRWLLPGLTVTIEVAPDKVGQHECFSVEWAGVPTVTEACAAGHPAYADPRGVRLFVLETRQRVPETTPMERTLMGPGPAFHVPQTGPKLDVANWNTACTQAIEQAGTLPAPAGQVRAVAIVVAMRMVLLSASRSLITGAPNPEGHDARQHRYQHAMTGNDAVLAVTIPGQAPYAVFVKGFKSPRDKPMEKLLDFRQFLPALVPAVDGRPEPTIVWDEVQPPPAPQLPGTIEGLRMVGQMLSQKRARWAAASTPHPGPGLPPIAYRNAARFAAYYHSLPPEQRPATLQSAIASLDTVAPHERPAYLALWRQHGLPV